jgi:membrane-associated protease RseP (regulator of RpoE activity)
MPALALGLIILSIALHVLGHALAMKRYGIGIERAGLGLGVGPRLTFRVPRVEFPLTLSPFLVGAYVLPAEGESERIKELPYRAQALIFGSGVLANLLFGLLILSGLSLFYAFEPLYSRQRSLTVSVVALTLAWGLWAGRYFVCRYLVPLLGVGLLAYVVYGLFFALGGSGAMGPVGITREVVANASSPAKALEFAALISLGIGMTNMLPLLPLDGGRIFQAGLSKVNQLAANIWGGLSLCAGLALIVLILTNDFRSI